MNHFQLLISQSMDVITKQASIVWFKLPVCFFMAGISFFFGIQNQSIIAGLVMLVGFDTLMGFLASYYEGTPITSRRALKSATKLAVYAILVSASYLTEQAVPFETLIDEAMISFLALTELISIMENAGRMGFSVPQKLLNRLHDMQDKKIV